MLRVAPLSHQQAAILAVGALDNLVTELVQATRARLPADFLDWIADEATPLVERRVFEWFHHPAFAGRLHRSDPRIALAHIVREWIAPHMTVHFAALAARLHHPVGASPEPAIRHAAPAADQPVTARAPRSWRIPRAGHAGLRIKAPAPLA